MTTTTKNIDVERFCDVLTDAQLVTIEERRHYKQELSAALPASLLALKGHLWEGFVNAFEDVFPRGGLDFYGAYRPEGAPCRARLGRQVAFSRKDWTERDTRPKALHTYGSHHDALTVLDALVCGVLGRADAVDAAMVEVERANEAHAAVVKARIAEVRAEVAAEREALDLAIARAVMRTDVDLRGDVVAEVTIRDGLDFFGRLGKSKYSVEDDPRVGWVAAALYSWEHEHDTDPATVDLAEGMARVFLAREPGATLERLVEAVSTALTDHYDMDSIVAGVKLAVNPRRN